MEEERLVPEEMRRVLSYLNYLEVVWTGRAHQRTDVDEALGEGLAAYALKQANIRDPSALVRRPTVILRTSSFDC